MPYKNPAAKRAYMRAWQRENRKVNGESVRAYKRQYREKNKERLRAQERAHYKQRREHFLAKARAYRENNPEKVREATGRWNKKHPTYYADLRLGRRLAVIEALGGKCVRCGHTDYRVLQVDHPNGGGRTDRGNSTDTFYHKVIAHPERYQLLCANCNWLKYYMERK